MADQEAVNELVKQAKISYDQQSAALSEEDSILERTLTCPICSEIFVDPVFAMPCTHTFCGKLALLEGVGWADSSERVLYSTLGGG